MEIGFGENPKKIENPITIEGWVAGIQTATSAIAEKEPASTKTFYLPSLSAAKPVARRPKRLMLLASSYKLRTPLGYCLP